MTKEWDLQLKLDGWKMNAEKVTAAMVKDPSLVGPVLDGLSSKVSRVKFGCAKALLALSEKNPDLLYPKIGKVFEFLGSENRILKWNAILILGNLGGVDRDRRIPSVLPSFYDFLSGGELITANNAIIALGKIGRAFPEAQGQIAAHLLDVEREVFKTEECRNIAIGKAILALKMFVNPASAGKEVIEFARRQTANRRKATAEKAKTFLRSVSA